MGCIYLCKKCSKCGRVLPYIAFNRKLDRRRSECKLCQKTSNHKYYENNKRRVSEKQKEYLKSESGILTQFKHASKRREIMNSYGEITKDQWLEMMNFFDWKCAYSGEYLGGNKESRSVDHIIPLLKGGEHCIWNLIPMRRNYNASKQDKNMIEWYKQQTFYSVERLNKIYLWQGYAYNKYFKYISYAN